MKWFGPEVTSVCCLTEKADDISGKITYELSEYTVHIRWMEPKDPNGMIILYEVLYKRLGDTEVRCIVWILSGHSASVNAGCTLNQRFINPVEININQRSVLASLRHLCASVTMEKSSRRQ